MLPLHFFLLTTILFFNDPSGQLISVTRDTASAVAPTGVDITLQVWPNPAQIGKKAHLHVTGLALDSPVKVMVRAMKSDTVMLQHEMPAAATLDLDLPLENYSAGEYQVEISAPKLWQVYLLHVRK